jgi:amino-acid N-acetyltransferase
MTVAPPSSKTASAEAGAQDAEVALRPAEPQDEPILQNLLREAGLPFEDVACGQQDFVVAIVDGNVVGCVGLEMFEPAGLLRSLAVREPHRGSGLGSALFQRIIGVAREKRAERLFLLTTTAAPFFERRGFVPVDRSMAPEAMGKSTQFASLCPSTAACMTLPL